jgi:hypothetical protein
MSTVKTTLSSAVTKSSQALGKATLALGDKATWKPLDKGRTAQDQAVECAGISFLAVTILTGQAVPDPIDWSAMQKMSEENETGAKAAAILETATQALVAAIQAFPDDKWDATVVLPFGGGITKSFAEVVGMVDWNNTYHEGQVNYIQTLLAE